MVDVVEQFAPLNRSSSDRFMWNLICMRADRLVAILNLLQVRGQVTALEVSEELEVSERTARRDLEALGQAGVPIYSLQGRNGGWRLAGGGKTDLSGLTAEETRALVPGRRPVLGRRRRPCAPRCASSCARCPNRSARRPTRRASASCSTAGWDGDAPRHRPHAAPARRGAAVRRRRSAGVARLRGPRRVGDDAHHRSARPRVEGRALVPRRQHRRRACARSASTASSRMTETGRAAWSGPTASTSTTRGNSSPTSSRRSACRSSPSRRSTPTCCRSRAGCSARACASAHRRRRPRQRRDPRPPRARAVGRNRRPRRRHRSPLPRRSPRRPRRNGQQLVALYGIMTA